MKTPIKKKNGDSDPITLADDPQDHGEATAAAAPTPAAVPVGLSFVRMTAARTFDNIVTIALADLPHIILGSDANGPHGYGVISYQGRMFSQVGVFEGDDNPAHTPFLGFPVYVEV